MSESNSCAYCGYKINRNDFYCPSCFQTTQYNKRHYRRKVYLKKRTPPLTNVLALSWLGILGLSWITILVFFDNFPFSFFLGCCTILLIVLVYNLQQFNVHARNITIFLTALDMVIIFLDLLGIIMVIYTIPSAEYSSSLASMRFRFLVDLLGLVIGIYTIWVLGFDEETISLFN